MTARRVIHFMVGFACLANFRVSIPATNLIKNALTFDISNITFTVSVAPSNHDGPKSAEKDNTATIALSNNKEPTLTTTAQIQIQAQGQTQTQLENKLTGNKRPLKFFAIHIGPSKTGTSTIQKDLANNPFGVNTLGEDKDNVVYVGRLVPGVKGTMESRKINGTSMTRRDVQISFSKAVECMQALLENYYESSNSDRAATKKRIENDEDTKSFLRKDFTDKCWVVLKGNTTKLDIRYMLDSSIVDSDEEYSWRSENHQKFKDIGTRFQIFNILGYERLVVVAAYRRYADWIVSSYTQSIKTCIFKSNDPLLLSKTAPCTSFEYVLNKTMKRNGTDKYDTSKYYNIHRTLPLILEEGPSKTEAKILNYFQLPHNTQHERDANAKSFGSITTELYCDAFGKELTPHTCSHAQDVEAARNRNETKKMSKRALKRIRNMNASPIVNKGTTSNGAYQQIVAEGFQRGLLLLSDVEIQAQTDPRKLQIVKTLQRRNSKTTAIVGTNSSSTTIATNQALSEHHTRVCNKRPWTESLPWKCPPVEQLHKLLHRSLEFEQRVMPEFYATPLGRDEHERLFWEKALGEQKFFCWVDIERLFRNASSWDEIINDRMVHRDWD